MGEQHPSEQRVLEDLVISPEVAERIQPMFGQALPEEGRVTAALTQSDALELQRQVLLAEAAIAKEKAAAEAAEKARLAEQAKERQESQRNAAAARNSVPRKQPHKWVRRAGVVAIVGAIIAPSVHDHFQNNTKTDLQIAFDDTIMGTLGVPMYYANKIGSWLNGDDKRPKAKALTSASPTPSISTNTAPTQSPSSTPTPSASSVLDNLPKAKDLASIQNPQPQPFSYNITFNKDGDIQGRVGLYKADSGLTIEEVQWMESCGNTSKNVLIGIDDRGSEAHIRAMAKVLTDIKSGAIFFLNTKTKDGKNPAVSQVLIDDLRNLGFGVANHSATHPDMTKMSNDAINQEIVNGGPSNLLRLPYGGTYKGENGNIYVDSRVLQVAKETGAAVCGWTKDTRDWSETATKESIVKSVMVGLQEGDNILVHADDNYPTLDALPELIKGIRDAGYDTCPISTTPTSPDFSITKVCSPN